MAYKFPKKDQCWHDCCTFMSCELEGKREASREVCSEGILRARILLHKNIKALLLCVVKLPVFIYCTSPLLLLFDMSIILRLLYFLFFKALLLPPANFHFFLPICYLPTPAQHISISLSFHPSPPLQCSHLIIPLRNIFTSEQWGSY